MVFKGCGHTHQVVPAAVGIAATTFDEKALYCQEESWSNNWQSTICQSVGN